jgi:4-hydroxybenzoate polyprenyltransferase
VQIIAVIGTSVALLVILGWPFVQYSGFVPLWITWLLATTFYSMPPVRLKERGLLGLVTTIVAQQPLPAAMVVAALGGEWTWSTWLFILYITLRGICSDVGHQMRDRARDQLAGARTFAVTRGHAVIARLYGVGLELEALVLGALFITLAAKLPGVVINGWSVSPLWPILALYALLFATTIGRAWRQLNRGAWVDPYDESPEGPPRDLLHFLHMTFPTVILPLVLSLWLTWYNWLNVVFVVGLLLLYRMWDPQLWAKTLPVRLLRSWMKMNRRSRP